MLEHGEAAALRLVHLHRPPEHGTRELGGETLAELGQDLVGELRLSVERRDDERDHRRLASLGGQARQALHDLGAAVEREVGERDRQHDLARRPQDVLGDERDRGRRVEEHEVPAAGRQRLHHLAQLFGAIGVGGHLNREGRERLVGREQVEPRHRRGADHLVERGRPEREEIAHRRREPARVHAERLRGMSLGVEVGEQHPLPVASRKPCADVHAERGLAGSTLLVHEGDAAHGGGTNLAPDLGPPAVVPLTHRGRADALGEAVEHLLELPELLPQLVDVLGGGQLHGLTSPCARHNRRWRAR